MKVVSIMTGYGMSKRVKFHALRGRKTLCGKTPNFQVNAEMEPTGVNWKSSSAFVCQACAKKVGAK